VIRRYVSYSLAAQSHPKYFEVSNDFSTLQSMNRYRAPTLGGPSKATASTLCQKCLKRGHYSYECKAPAQERPYASRPSRTQQLLNPKLVPKLTSDVPNDLLRKKGVADEQLAKREEERGRKRGRDEDDGPAARKRSRSISSYSSSSVSTISTTVSRSPPPRSRPQDDTYYTSQRDHSPISVPLKPGHKRRRSSSSSMSYTSISSIESRRKSPTHRDRNTRARRSSVSPDERGRRRSRLRSNAGDDSGRTRSRSLDQSRIARNRQSLTNDGRGRDGRDGRDRRREEAVSPGYGPKYRRDAQRRYSNNHERYGSSFRDGDQHSGEVRRERPPPVRKERSLSPFSKRLALTQAMNMGR